MKATEIERVRHDRNIGLSEGLIALRSKLIRERGVICPENEHNKVTLDSEKICLVCGVIFSGEGDL